MLLQKLIWLRRSQKKFLPADSDRAGTQGEQIAYHQLHGILKELGGKPRIFQSLRVPKPKDSGKFEIDLLLVSETAVLVIEVKHWSGHLTRERDGWVQERGSAKKAVQDPLRLNQEKLLALHQWLLQRNVAIPLKCFHSYVLFTHPQVTFSPDLRSAPEVVSVSMLLALAIKKCSSPGRLFWQQRSRTDFHFYSLIEALDQLPTWDRIQLHGGRVMRGDLESIVLPEVDPLALQRKQLKSAWVRMSRRLFPGIFLRAKVQLRDWSGKSSSYPLHPEARLMFRAAGQSDQKEILWLHIESLQLGWKDSSSYDPRSH